MPHLGNTLARHPDSTQAPRPSNTLALHRVNPAPRQIHPRSASGPQRPNTVSGSTPVPHRAHNIPALPRGPSQEPRNKKSVRIATFLRLAIVASSPIANRGTKTQVICRVKAPFRFAGTGKSSQSQKSCRDAEIFVFTMGGLPQQVDFVMGGLPQRVDIAMGGSLQRGKSRRCAYSRWQRG